MHTSKSLSLLAVALIQGLAAAAPAPQGVPFPINGTATTTGSTAIGTGPPHMAVFPTGTFPTGTAPHSQAPPIGTGTGSSPSSVVPIAASSSIISASGTSMVDGFTTTLSTMTQTKTLTWTVMVPCTTVAAGTTSYYTTASVYTTCVPDLKTITITSACTKCAYATPTPAGPGGPGAPGPSVIKPAESTPTGPACPGGANCPPAGGYSTKTVQEIKTVVPIVVPSGQTSTSLVAGVPSSPAGPAKGPTSVIAGSGACPAVSTVTVYNPTTIYATVTVTPAAYTPSPVGCKDGNCGTHTIAPTGHPSSVAPGTGCHDGKCTTVTTVVGCSSGKCTTITTVYTKTFTNWNGTASTATFKPTGTGFATGLTTATLV